MHNLLVQHHINYSDVLPLLSARWDLVESTSEDPETLADAPRRF